MCGASAVLSSSQGANNVDPFAEPYLPRHPAVNSAAITTQSAKAPAFDKNERLEKHLRQQHRMLGELVDADPIWSTKVRAALVAGMAATAFTANLLRFIRLDDVDALADTVEGFIEGAPV